MKPSTYNTKEFVIIIVMFLLLPTVSFTQEQGIGIMPIRVKINLRESGFWSTFNNGDLILNPKLDANSESSYEDLYLSIILENLPGIFKKKKIDVAMLSLDSMSEEERQTEEQVYNSMTNEFAAYSSQNTKSLFKSESIKKAKQSGKNKLYTKEYGAQLGQPYLVYFTFSGIHYLTKKEKDKNQLRKFAKGHFYVFAWIVDAETGLIVDHVNTEIKDLNAQLIKGYKYSLTEKRIIGFLKIVAQKTVKKIKKLF